MPKVEFAGRSIECLEGANLRTVLVHARLTLYRSASAAINCRGRGRCGTCAVSIEGPVSEPTQAEERRLSRFPHRRGSGLRLACQVSVLGDLTVERHDGTWGTAGS